jgi:hypothetical protein
MENKNNNKFYTILNTFSNLERNEFCEFLDLSFIKKPRLSKIVIEKINSGTDLDEYLKTKYSARTQWNIYSELTVSIKQFVALKEILLDKEEMHRLKRKQLFRRDLTKPLILDYRNVIKLKLAEKLSSESMKEISKTAYDCLHSLFKKGEFKETDPVYKVFSDFHVLSFILEIMTFDIDMEIRNKFYGEKDRFLNKEIFSFIDFESILTVIKNLYPEYNNIFYVIYNLNKVTRDPADFESFKIAKDIFLSDSSLLSDRYKYDLFNMFVNIGNLITKSQKMDMHSELFELMSWKIKEGLTEDLRETLMGGNHFREYTLVAISVNEHKWAEEFIKKYSSILPKDLRENSVNTAMAFLQLHRKNYDEAIAFISKLKRTYLIHDLDYFRIMIGAYFESGNLLECLSVKRHFQEYMRKSSRFVQTYKKSSQNFLGCLTKLINYKESGKKKILNDLEYEVKNSNELIWRIWLEKMIGEMKA